MRQAEDSGDRLPAGGSDAELWRRSRLTEIAADEAADFLYLAGFADGMLDDEDERERVAALLAGDPDRAGDVAASRGIVPEAAPDAVVARAAALVAEAVADPGPRGVVVPFVRPIRIRPAFHPVMRWGSLAAAILVASWLGFALGRDASLALDRGVRHADESAFGEWPDPSADVLRNLTDGLES